MTESSPERWYFNPWIVTIIGGLIVAILAALIVPKIRASHTSQYQARAGAGASVVMIPMDTACKWAYPGRATGIVTGSGDDIVCLGTNGKSLGGFPDGSGHSLNDWCASPAHTDEMNLIQAKLTPSGWACTFL